MRMRFFRNIQIRIRAALSAAALAAAASCLAACAGLAGEPTGEQDQTRSRIREETQGGGFAPVCTEGRAACCLLQLIMAGELDGFAADDMLNLRIYSALLPQLALIGEGDLTHYAGEFDEAYETVELKWYEAMADCLYADILYRQATETSLDDADLVMLLFLKTPDADEVREIEEIRERITQETIGVIAEAEQVPPDFVAWLTEKSF